MVRDEHSDGASHETAGRTARRFFEGLWADGDPWGLETAELDQRRYDRQRALVADRRYGRALELGCGAGSFTRHLAPLCDNLVALDIAESAISRAERSGAQTANVEFRVANIMEFDPDPEGPWDLVVLTETAYYLGWLYPMFDVGWLAHSLHAATTAGGRLLLVNTVDGDANGLLSPWLIRTYHDLFRNTGYHVEAEETLHGDKEGTRFEILLSLFAR